MFLLVAIPLAWPLPLKFRLRLSISSLASKARLFSSATDFQPVALLSAPHVAFRGYTAETPTTSNASSLTVLPSRQAGSYHVTTRDDSVRYRSRNESMDEEDIISYIMVIYIPFTRICRYTLILERKSVF